MIYSKAYKHTDGYYYIMTGTKKFLLASKSSTEQGAKQNGALLSAEHYLNQANKAIEQAKKGINTIDVDNALFDRIYSQVWKAKDFTVQVHEDTCESGTEHMWC